MLRITALEEHFVTRAVVDAWRSVDARWQDLALGLSSQGRTARRLLDIGADRVTEMDDAGITVQVLSLSTPGLAMLAPADAVALQSMTNDQLAYSIAKMKEDGIVDSGDTLKLGIGAMTDAHWKNFYDKMVHAGVVKPGLDYKKGYTLQFVNKGVGLDLRPKN